MPFLRIQTNQDLGTEPCQTLARTASATIAKALGKPEQYMMVGVVPGCAMTFAGTGEPAAFAELNGIGLPEAKSGELSGILCELIQSAIGVPKERIYINFTDVSPTCWGWNGKTF